MIKKGRLEGNVVNGTVVETLLVQFEDLVQVVAKAGCLCVSAFWSFVLTLWEVLRILINVL